MRGPQPFGGARPKATNPTGDQWVLRREADLRERDVNDRRLLCCWGRRAYAASHLGKNTVGPKQLKKNSVPTAKIKNEAVTAAKVEKGTLTGNQINASTLGTVPTSNTAQIANSLSSPEALHKPTLLNNWKNPPPTGPFAVFPPVAFYKDHDGVVHLSGFALGGEATKPIFQLPPASGRPASASS